MTAWLVPLTVDGLILAASMLTLDANRRNGPVPLWPAGAWAQASPATVSANLAHGLGHGPIGALVSAWPALALVGSFELLMTLIRTGKTQQHRREPSRSFTPGSTGGSRRTGRAKAARRTLEQTMRAWYGAGRSQRAIARELNVDRRKVKRIIDHTA